MVQETDKYPWIVPISQLLTWKKMVQIGVEYLGFSVTDMLIIAEEAGNLGAAKREILYQVAGKENGEKVGQE